MNDMLHGAAPGNQDTLVVPRVPPLCKFHCSTSAGCWHIQSIECMHTYVHAYVHTVGIKKSLHCDPQYVRITYVLLCAITLRNNREYRNYAVQLRSVVPLGSLSVLFKHWLNFDLVFSMPLNRRWPTYVEISWPTSQLSSSASHISRRIVLFF